MGNTRLVDLTIRHFRSVRDEIHVEFPDSGLVLLSSKNFDTGGSSGAGKSTIMLALAAALDYCHYPATELQNWDTEEPLYLRLRLDSDTHGSVVLTRGSRSSLTVGEETVTGSKAISDKLQEILGIDSPMLAALTYSPQDDQNDFLSKTNAEKQEFLTRLLGLDTIEAAVETATKNLAALEKQVSGWETGVRLTSDAVTKAQSALQALEPDFEVDERPLEVSQSELEQQKLVVASCRQAKERAEAERTEAIRALQAPFELRIAEATNVHRQLQKELEVASAVKPSVSPEEQRLEQLLSVGRLKIQEAKAKDAEREREFRAEVSQLDSAISRVRTRVQDLPRLHQELVACLREIPLLEASSCPTCGQQWQESAKKLAVWRHRADDLNARITALQEEGSQLPGLEAKRIAMTFAHDPMVGQLQGIVEQLQAQLAAEKQKGLEGQKTALAEIRARVADAHQVITSIQMEKATATTAYSDKHQGQVAALSSALWNAERILSGLSVKVTQLSAELKARQERRQYLRSQRTLAEAQLQRDTQLLETATRVHNEGVAAISAEKDFIKLMGREGFLGAIFDEVLAEISDETNNILSRVANTAHVVLEFHSEIENKKGTVRKEIRPVVTIGGRVAPLRSGCSGGMLNAVRLAVRLAVRRVSSRRKGAYPAWLCLDESFNGLDNVSKEACLEILAEAAKEDVIFVVDHSSEFKSLFTQTINLEFRSGITTLGGQ